MILGGQILYDDEGTILKIMGDNIIIFFFSNSDTCRSTAFYTLVLGAGYFGIGYKADKWQIIISYVYII